MTRWISLYPGWKLQDVQAGPNVVLTALFAGSIFTLVRWHWILAARKVLQKERVPAYLLLSLNTVGEAIDVIILLGTELLSRQFAGLLFQTICVVLLTIAAMLAGFIARFSTQDGTITQTSEIPGLIAERQLASLSFSFIPVNATMNLLTRAKFPPTQLLGYLPTDEADWIFEASDWNSSWSMDCDFENFLPVIDPRSTDNCTDISTEVPFINDNWQDWDPLEGGWQYQLSGWTNSEDVYDDVLFFSHGIEFGSWDTSLNDTWMEGYMWTNARVRTVALHLQDVPANVSASEEDCLFLPGKIPKASYSSFTCNLTRNLTGVSAEEAYWGAYPESADLKNVLQAYMDRYGYSLQQTSKTGQKYEQPGGEELVLLYQAYTIVRDTTPLNPVAPQTRQKVLSTSGEDLYLFNVPKLSRWPKTSSCWMGEMYFDGMRAVATANHSIPLASMQDLHEQMRT